jgi:hypothetical protein
MNVLLSASLRTNGTVPPTASHTSSFGVTSKPRGSPSSPYLKTFHSV